MMLNYSRTAISATMTEQLPAAKSSLAELWAFQLHARYAYGCGSEATTSAFLAVVEVWVED